MVCAWTVVWEWLEIKHIKQKKLSDILVKIMKFYWNVAIFLSNKERQNKAVLQGKIKVLLYYGAAPWWFMSRGPEKAVRRHPPLSALLG